MNAPLSGPNVVFNPGQLSTALLAARPETYLTDHFARMAWYACVTEFANLLKPWLTAREMTKWFDDCGVPS